MPSLWADISILTRTTFVMSLLTEEMRHAGKSTGYCLAEESANIVLITHHRPVVAFRIRAPASVTRNSPKPCHLVVNESVSTTVWFLSK
jgi:hypothetical protein